MRPASQCAADDPNYWPWLIERSRKQWPTLERQANVAKAFNFESLSFEPPLPDDSFALRAFLEKLADH